MVSTYGIGEFVCGGAHGLTCTLMSPISATSDFLISSDNGTNPASLNRIKGEINAAYTRRKVYERLRDKSAKADWHGSGHDDIPFTSDSFFATFGVLDFFPITVLWSQSGEGPSMSTAGVVWGLVWSRCNVPGR